MGTTGRLIGKNGLELTLERQGRGMVIKGPPGERADEWFMSEQTYTDVMAKEYVDHRLRVCACATAELGKADLAKYWTLAFGSHNAGFDGKAWCGIFALYCLKTAGLTDASWVIGKGFISQLKLKATDDPKPGDIAYFAKHQHHAILLEKRQVLGDTMLTLVNGNGAGGVVTLSQLRPVAVTAFYSIQRLIDKATTA